MARQEKPVDVVMVGLGWTNAIMAMELAETGLSLLALERGEDRDTVPDFAYPRMIDELTYGVRNKLMLPPADNTLTIRHSLKDTALPYRVLGSFLPGNGVGGAGTHWNGHTWRPEPAEFRLKSHVVESFGANVIPEEMTIQDYPVSYDELEPYFDRFEKVAGISGKAGNLRGTIQEGGNPFEGARSDEYPMPPLPPTYNGVLFADAARGMGYHPFRMPAANASRAYTNPYGMTLGPCNYCGFCERFGCINYSKSSPQACILPVLKTKPNFAYRTHAEVIRIDLDRDRKRAIGVTYVDAHGEEVFQPADLVISGAFAYHNVRLLMLSGIGEIYDPVKNTGQLGRNYAYQMTGGHALFFKDKVFNPFVGTGSNATSMMDFGVGQLDMGALGFVGGTIVTSAQYNGQPIRSLSLPAGSKSWGSGWKKAAKDWYGHSMSIGIHASNMSYRDCCLDLDPTYKDRHGLPLLRLTFDWKANDLKMSAYLKGQVETLAKSLAPDSLRAGYKDMNSHYDVRPYQSTHNVGGAIMGASPHDSVLNRYCQSWDVPNVFVLGASAFPQNIQFNPTGLVGALAYWTARAIREDYLKDPRPLVQA